MSIDHSTDATSRDHVRERDEAQQREIARLRGEVKALGISLFLYKSLCAALISVLVWGVIAVGFFVVVAIKDSRRDSRERDAAQAQAALYLDGWKECVKTSGSDLVIEAGTNDPPDVQDRLVKEHESTPITEPFVFNATGSQFHGAKKYSFQDASQELGYIDGHDVWHCAVPDGTQLPHTRGSLLDPTRRIDR